MYRLGIDIGGAKINIGFVNEDNQIIYKKNIILTENRDYRNVLNLINKELSNIDINKDSILSAGIGVQGTVSKDGKIAVKVPNIGWENAGIAEEFEKLTGIPTVLVQDSRAAALGEAVLALMGEFDKANEDLHNKPKWYFNAFKGITGEKSTISYIFQSIW